MRKPSGIAPGSLSHQYLLSLPERALRSMSALSAGLLRELSEVVLPRAVRRTRLYTELVENTLRFLIENVGQVEGAYPPQGKLADDFAMRRFAGNGIELIGLLTFSASPVWVLAALADLSGTGRQLIREIAQSLKEEGLLAAGADYETIDQLLDGLEGAAGRLGQKSRPPFRWHRKPDYSARSGHDSPCLRPSGLLSRESSRLFLALQSSFSRAETHAFGVVPKVRRNISTNALDWR